MKAPIRFAFVEDWKTLFIQKTDIANEVNFDTIIAQKIRTLILPDIKSTDLFWFNTVLDNLYRIKPLYLSFQGDTICLEAYTKTKSTLQALTFECHLSFSVEIAASFKLEDDEIISKVDYSADFATIQHYNTKALTYKVFKQIVPYVLIIKDAINSFKIDDQLEQILYIDNWIQKNIQYIKSGDFIARGERYIYPQIKEEAIVSDVLINHFGTCEDIAASISAILKMIGIKSEVIGGNGHAWNLVFICNNWFIWDCTHNITRSRNKVFNELKTAEYNHTYTLRGANFEPHNYYRRNALFEIISTEDFPQQVIEQKKHKMELSNIIESTYGDGVILKRNR